MVGITWNAENDRKLLLAIIRSGDTKVDLDRVTTMFNDDSDIQATKIAIQSRYARLRQKENKEGDGQKAAPSTPTGNGKATDSASKKTPGIGGGRGKKKAADNNNDAAETPPAKRQKTAIDAKKTTAKGKAKGKSAAKDTTMTDNDDGYDEDVKKEESDNEQEKAAEMSKLDAEILALGSD